MTNRYLVDSDVLIDFLRGHKSANLFFQENIDRICFSPITVAEIVTGVKTKEEFKVVNRLFSAFPVLNVTKEIAMRAGEFMQKFSKSSSVELPDAIIAATSEINHMQLKTLNTKHFPMFKDIKPPYCK